MHSTIRVPFDRFVVTVNPISASHPAPTRYGPDRQIDVHPTLAGS